MINGKVRIYELARELDIDNRAMLAVCEQLNISVKSHSSTITEIEAAMIRSAAEKYTPSHSFSRDAIALSLFRKQQIVEIRRKRQHPPEASLKPIVRNQSLPTSPIRPLLKRSILPGQPRTGQGYIEPLLDVGSALPLHMVLITSGRFTMGSPASEPERQDSEEPQHDVTVPSFFLGRYPVTQAQWRFIAGLPPIKQALTHEPCYFNFVDNKDNHPVEQVSWHDAIEFCARLEKHTNRPYRLPTEAEWEYACRAGTTTPFYFGKSLQSRLATYRDSKKRTVPVDFLRIANAFGLSDMHGNVWEWCQDHWHKNYEGAPIDGSAWLTDGDKDWRIVRGGSWNNDPGNCRSASRFYYFPVNRDSDIGFRVCCSAPRTL